MREIVFTADFGGDRREVRIVDAFGSAGAGYQVYVANYYYGNLFKRPDGWVLHSITNLLTSDDIQILAEMVDDELAK